jgi:hypothetical protein
MNNVGQKIMEGIIGHNLIRTECAENPEHNCVTVWSSGAAEQIEAMAAKPRSEGLVQAKADGGCLDCGAPYPFGLDMVLPDQQWRHIVPGGSGVLCPTCICKRSDMLKGATVVLAWIDCFDWTAPRPAEWFSTESAKVEQADARLNAAAPDLLSACRTAVECCERQPSPQEYEHMYIELKAAILKAEGQ